MVRKDQSILKTASGSEPEVKEARLPTPNLDRIAMLRQQLTAKQQALADSEEELERLLGEMRERDLDQLKTAKVFGGRADLERKCSILMDGIAQAKNDLPLIGQAIAELGQQAIPEIIQQVRLECEARNQNPLALLDDLVTTANHLWDLLRANMRGREEFGQVTSAAVKALVEFGMNAPQAQTALHTGGVPMYAIKSRDLPFLMKRLIDIAFSAPIVRIEGSRVCPPKLVREDLIEPRSIRRANMKEEHAA